MKKQLAGWSFLMAAGELVYISLVATFMQSGEKIFGKEVGILGPIAFLLLFVFSASLSGQWFWENRFCSILMERKKTPLCFLLILWVGSLCSFWSRLSRLCFGNRATFLEYAVNTNFLTYGYGKR